MTLPLAGVLILDLADEPLALAGRLLADLGADVVRVEDAAGDALRRRGPWVGGEPGVERGLAHLLYNAGKRSVALDLAHSAAPSILDQLAAKADAIIAPMEPHPTVAALLAEERLRAIAPGANVVDAVLRRDGTAPAVADIAGMAAGGHLVLDGFAEDAPNHPAGNLAYKQTSLAAALAALALILETAASGRAGRITVCMQEAVMWTTIQSANENYWPWLGQRPSRRGIANLGGQTIFPTRDGRWVSFYQHPPSWPAFVSWAEEALGERRFSAPEWDDFAYRSRNHATVVEVTLALCALMDRDAIVAEAQRRQVLAVPVQTVDDIAHDPHLRERGFFQQVDHPHLGATFEVMRHPFVSSAYEALAAPAPVLGQHTRTVLAEAGFDPDAIDGMVESGAVSAVAEGVLA